MDRRNAVSRKSDYLGAANQRSIATHGSGQVLEVPPAYLVDASRGKQHTRRLVTPALAAHIRDVYAKAIAEITQNDRQASEEPPDFDQSATVETVFAYYRSRGYPYYPTSKAYRDAEFDRLRGFDCTTKFQPETLTVEQEMSGLGLAWSYFPHHIGVRCGKMRTPLEVFESDELFKKAISKAKRLTSWTDGGIRKMLKMYSGTQSVSNFRPTAAAAIYHHFAGKGSTVWDMSCGYGGRLLGAIIAGVNYLGTEPCSLTYDGLVQLAKDYGRDIHVELHRCGSEDFIPEKSSLDFCFTSPPYFDQEKYSDEQTQSYMRFPTPESWIKGFLGQTFSNCHYGLKPGKHMVVNIANTQRFPNMVKGTISVAEAQGFEHLDTGELLLSQLNSGGFKSEPLLVFRRLP